MFCVLLWFIFSYGLSDASGVPYGPLPWCWWSWSGMMLTPRCLKLCSISPPRCWSWWRKDFCPPEVQDHFLPLCCVEVNILVLGLEVLNFYSAVSLDTILPTPVASSANKTLVLVSCGFAGKNVAGEKDGAQHTDLWCTGLQQCSELWGLPSRKFQSSTMCWSPSGCGVSYSWWSVGGCIQSCLRWYCLCRYNINQYGWGLGVEVCVDVTCTLFKFPVSLLNLPAMGLL